MFLPLLWIAAPVPGQNRSLSTEVLGVGRCVYESVSLVGLGAPPRAGMGTWSSDVPHARVGVGMEEVLKKPI